MFILRLFIHSLTKFCLTILVYRYRENDKENINVGSNLPSKKNDCVNPARANGWLNCG